MISDVDEFLNAFDGELFDGVALKIWNNPSILDDTRLLCFHGNSVAILYKFVYHIYGIKNIRKTEEYGYSDKHMEFVMTDDAMTLIKDALKSKTIDNRRMIYLIKQPCKKLLKLHKRFFEKSVNATFIFAVPNVSTINQDIRDMCWCIHCGFKEAKVRDYLGDNYWEGEDFLNMLVRSKYGIKKTSLESTIEKFLTMPIGNDNAKECRDLAHKMFHMNVPFAWMAKCVIRQWKVPARLSDIIKAAAECDLNSGKILVYERFLLYVTAQR